MDCWTLLFHQAVFRVAIRHYWGLLHSQGSVHAAAAEYRFEQYSYPLHSLAAEVVEE